jgi:hypothetical protein
VPGSTSLLPDHARFHLLGALKYDPGRRPPEEYSEILFVHAQLMFARNHASGLPEQAAGMKLEESGNTWKEGDFRGTLANTNVL